MESQRHPGGREDVREPGEPGNLHRKQTVPERALGSSVFEWEIKKEPETGIGITCHGGAGETKKVAAMKPTEGSISGREGSVTYAIKRWNKERTGNARGSRSSGDLGNTGAAEEGGQRPDCSALGPDPGSGRGQKLLLEVRARRKPRGVAGEGRLGGSLPFPGRGAVRREVPEAVGGPGCREGGGEPAATDRHFHGMLLTLQQEGRQRMWGRPMATELGGSFCLNACFF